VQQTKTKKRLIMDFDYKKYSLEQLENWVHDAMSAGEATPQEIYDVIVEVVKENYYVYKNQVSKAYELLALLNGNGKGHIQAYDDAIGHSNYYDRNDPNRKNPSASEYSENKGSYDQMIANGYTMTDDGFWIPPEKQDKVVKWQLPVQQKIEEGIDDYYVQFPDDLLEAANLKEGDVVNWIDRGDGSFELRKVTKPLEMDEC
jgi:hypothetical protein